MEKIYRIIGDIHGRINWRQLIDFSNPDVVYIFLGDYTDPYYYNEDKVTREQMLEVIDEIISLKKEHPDNVILLWGNHDLQYIINDGDTNRFDMMLCPTLHKIFTDNEKLFHGIAYNIGEKYLVSHAGVTRQWYCQLRGQHYAKDETTLEEIARHINDIWDSGRDGKTMFTFKECCTKFSDYYGTSSTHSPLWIRPWSLWQHNLFGFNSGKIQVVGHTISEPMTGKHDDWGRIGTIGTTYGDKLSEQELSDGLYINDGEHKCLLTENDPEKVDIILCDCLAKETACIEIDKNLNWRKMTPERLKQEK